ncbi:unnamed protein product, partial [Nesidiocoris tenuis]
MFGDFKVSNKDLVLVSEDTKMPLPAPLSFEDYLGTVTGQDYKPRLTTDLQELRKKELVKLRSFDWLFYILTTLVAALCFLFILTLSNDSLYYNVRAIRDGLSFPHGWDEKTRRMSPPINSVHSKKNQIGLVIVLPVLVYYKGRGTGGLITMPTYAHALGIVSRIISRKHSDTDQLISSVALVVAIILSKLCVGAFAGKYFVSEAEVKRKYTTRVIPVKPVQIDDVGEKSKKDKTLRSSKRDSPPPD